jgi:hypothetical protein
VLLGRFGLLMQGLKNLFNKFFEVPCITEIINLIAV